MKISDKIRIIRKARGLSQMDLSFLLPDDGVSRQAISNWENGVYEPKLENVKDLANALNVSIDALVDDEVDLNNSSILQSVLNNDFKNDVKHKSPIYVKLNRSFRFAYAILGIVICVVFIILFAYSKTLINEIHISEVNPPEDPTTLLGGLQALKDYVVAVSARDKELEKNIIVVFQYVSYISLALAISFGLALGIVSFKSSKAIGMISQNNLVIYKKQPMYIKYEDITGIEKTRFGLKVITKNKEIKLNFISNSDEIISIYNQFKAM